MRLCSFGHFVLFSHVCENMRIFTFFRSSYCSSSKEWQPAYKIVQAKCYRHSRGGRKNLQKVSDQTQVRCVFIKLEHWIGLNGEGENGLRKMFCPGHFQALVTWAMFFLRPIYDRGVIVLVSHMRTPKVREWVHQVPPGVSGRAGIHTNHCWERTDEAGHPFRLPSICDDHTADLLPGSWPGLGVTLFFWAVVMANAGPSTLFHWPPSSVACV